MFVVAVDKNIWVGLRPIDARGGKMASTEDTKRQHFRFTAVSPSVEKHNQAFSMGFEGGKEGDAGPFPLVQGNLGVA